MTNPTNAVTDPESGLRYYEWQGRKLLSNTSLRRIIGMPFPLAAWQVNQAIDAGIALAGEIVKHEGEAIEDIRKLVRKEALSVRDRAADLGTRVHEAASLRTPVDKAEADVQPFLAQFYEAEKALDLHVLVNEAQCFNLTLGYAGSLDLIGTADPEGKGVRLALIDLKTGKGLYTEHALQLLGYAMADFIGANDVIDKAATDYLHACDTLAVLHLRPEGWEWVEIKPTPETFEAFSRMVGLANWLRSNESIEPHVVARMGTLIGGTSK